MGMLEVRVAGPVVVVWDDVVLTVTSLKGRALIAFLALHGRPVPRSTLAAMFWGLASLKNLRQLLYLLRRLPGSETWLSDGERVSVRAAVVDSGEGVLLEEFDSAQLPIAFREWLDQARVGREETLDVSEADALIQPLARLLVVARRVPPLSVLAAALEVSEARVFRSMDRAALTEVLGDRAAHRRLAAALEDPNEAAWHWRQAGAMDRAAESWAIAGDLEAALAVVENERLHLELLLRRLDELERGGDRVAHEAALDALSALKATSSDVRTAGESDVRRALWALRGQELEVALDLASAANGVAVRHGLDALAARSAVVIGQVRLCSGDTADALKSFEYATDSAHPQSSQLGYAGAGACLALMGRVEEALVHHLEALARARSLGDPVAVARGLCNVGSDLNRLGRNRSALLRYREAAVAAEALGDTALQRLALSNASVAALCSGSLGDCRTLVVEAYDLAREAGTASEQGMALDTRAELEAATGRLDEAMHWASRAAGFHGSAGSGLREQLSRTNHVLYEHEAHRVSEQTALAAIAALALHARPLLTWQTRLDLGLWCSIERIPALLADPPAERSPMAKLQEALVRSRLGNRENRASVLKLAKTPSPLQPLAAVAARALYGEGPEPASVVASLADGLLSVQREGLIERMGRFEAQC